MHIIIEGTDNTGKTTLAVELAKRLHMPIINRLYPRDTILDECLEILNTEKPYIIDRLFVSEIVYGKVKRNHSRLSEKDIELLENLSNEKRTFNIYCTGKLEDIHDACIREKEDFIKGKEIDKVYALFERTIEESNLDWHIYRIGDSIDELSNKILRYMIANDIEVYERY